MTVLSVVQQTCLKVGVENPTVLFSSTDREMVEFQKLVQECAEEVADAYDWQKLKTLNTITGDGSDTSFDLPSDYDRMIVTASLWSSRYLWAMDHVVDTDRWLELLTLPYTQVTGSWTIYGGQIHILDTMASGDTAKFFYISNLIIAPASGANKTAFTADDDTFRLSERLLEKCLTYKWLQNKRFDYTEAMNDYNIELASEINKDGGSKPILSGRPPVSWRSPGVAWPGTISGVIP